MKKSLKVGRTTIAFVLLLVIAVFLACILLPAVKAATLDTYHSGWKLIRETADEDGADFLTTYNLPIQGNFANKDSSSVANGGAYQIRSYAGSGIGTEYQTVGGAWMFVLCAKNYDVGADNTIDNTFSFNIVGWSRINGMLQVIAEGDCILGTQAVITYPIDSSHADDTDAVGALVDMTGVTYTHSGPGTTFAKTDVGLGVVAGMMIYVTSSNESNLVNGYYAVTSRTDDTIVCTTGSSGDATATVKCNPAFWVDTINLDETTKWPSVGVYNSGDNEVCFILVDTAGLEFIQFVIYEATPAATLECGDITVFGRPY